MKEVKVKRANLAQILQDNLKAHQKIFDEALATYKTRVIQVLERHLEDAREGRRMPESIYIAQPVNQSHEYKRAIRMMELSVEDEIVLTQIEFDQYVMDRWHWKQDFLVKNSAYSITAASTLQSNPEEA